MVSSSHACAVTRMKVSIGQTDSKRALGFTVDRGGKIITDFVLDRDQVAQLTAYLKIMQVGSSNRQNEGFEVFALAQATGRY